MIADERHGDTEPRRAIDYIPGYNRYSDRVEEDDEVDQVNSAGRGVEDGTTRRLNNALPFSQTQNQQAAVENEWARN